MAYERKDGTGALFKNLKKEKDTHADYQGDILIDGKDYWLNAWIKKGNRGQTFLSVSVREKKQKQDTPAQVQHDPLDESQIPF